MNPLSTPTGTSTETAAFEEAVSKIVDVVYRHPLHRELYLKALDYCLEERAVDEAELFLEGQPEYKNALQTSTALVNVLIEQGGLAYAEYDSSGALLTEERVEQFFEQGRNEDEIYDMVERRCVQTTEEGRATAILLDPVKRVRSYVASDPRRSDTFCKLLAFCSTPRSLEEINEAFDSDPALAAREKTGWQRVHASYLIDRMNEAGGLTWNNGWQTTPAGAALVADR